MYADVSLVFLVIGIYPISSVSTMPFQSSFLRDWHVSCQAESIFYNCSPVWGDHAQWSPWIKYGYACFLAHSPMENYCILIRKS